MPLHFVFVDFYVRQRNKSITIFEFFILSASNDQQLITSICHLNQDLLMAESSAGILIRYWYSRQLKNINFIQKDINMREGGREGGRELV